MLDDYIMTRGAFQIWPPFTIAWKVAAKIFHREAVAAVARYQQDDVALVLTIQGGGDEHRTLFVESPQQQVRSASQATGWPEAFVPNQRGRWAQQ